MPEPPLAEGKVRIIRKCKLSSIIEKPHLAIELGRDCLRHRAGMLVVDRNLIQRLIPLGGSKNHKRLNAVRKPRLLEARTPSRSISNRTISYNSEQESCDQTNASPFNKFAIRRPNTYSHVHNDAHKATKKWIPSQNEIIKIIIQRINGLKESINDPDFELFADVASTQLKSWNDENVVKSYAHELKILMEAYLDDGLQGLDFQIKYIYYGGRADRIFSKSDVLDQAKIADLRYPTEWYPATRTIQRKIHLHVGPTNSGKTYQALQRLEQARSGVYAGPLRLLAHEVYTKLNAKGIKCNLVTGDVRIINEDQDTYMASCTVEMVPINTLVDVAVIDEIQMIGDASRGWAWTQALLGLQAKELHLCGETRAVPLIRELAAAMGDDLEIHHYERLSPLRTMTSSLRGNMNHLRKGDCVVTFSRRGIHEIRKEIEKKTGKRVAIVYGNLPPEIRAQQAKLFNDPDNEYDFLVASDAIGMGLNLSIKRLIFETTIKYDGEKFVNINDDQIKQIAGRAGRYRIAYQAEEVEETYNQVGNRTKTPKSTNSLPPQNLGLVTTLDQTDLPRLAQAMRSKPQPIMSAGILPPTDVIMRFATYFPQGMPFSYILIRLHEISLMHQRFQMCLLKDSIFIADAIESIHDLTIRDRITFCAAPVSSRDPKNVKLIRTLAKCVANHRGGELLEIPELDLDLLDRKISTDKYYLSELESLHKSLITYIWLTYRFAGVFTNQAMAFYVKSLVEKNIDTVLAAFTSRSNYSKRRKAFQQKVMLERFGEEARNDASFVSASESHIDGEVLQDCSPITEFVDPPNQAAKKAGVTLQLLQGAGSGKESIVTA